MRVALAVDELHPVKWYLEHYLAQELAHDGHEVHVFTFGKFSSGPILDFGVQVHRLPYFMSIEPYHVPTLRAVASIIGFVRRTRPEVVHCQPLFSPISLIFLGCRKIGNHEVVGSLLTGAYSLRSLASKIKYFAAKFMTEQYILPRTKIVFAKSRSLGRILHRMFNIPTEKVCVVPLGADHHHFSPDQRIRNRTRRRLGIDPDDTVIVCSGNLAPSKRIDEVLMASAPLLKEGRNTKLLLLGGGDGTYVELLKTMCRRLGISKSVIFHSWVTRTDLPSLFGASDIAVWPGGASISMVEAASMGLPLISMKSPVESYALSNQNGFFYDAGDINELQKLLETLIRNPKMRSDMGHRSRQLVEQRLNWETIAKEYVDHYRQAMEYTHRNLDKLQTSPS